MALRGEARADVVLSEIISVLSLMERCRRMLFDIREPMILPGATRRLA